MIIGAPRRLSSGWSRPLIPRLTSRSLRLLIRSPVRRREMNYPCAHLSLTRNWKRLEKRRLKPSNLLRIGQSGWSLSKPQSQAPFSSGMEEMQWLPAPRWRVLSYPCWLLHGCSVLYRRHCRKLRFWIQTTHPLVSIHTRISKPLGSAAYPCCGLRS